VAQKKSRNRNAKPVEPEKGRHRGLLWGGIAVAVIAVGAALIYSYRGPNPGGEGKNTALAAQYVGSSACESCHGNEASAWRKSQHHDAMAQAGEQSVLGNFNNAKFPYAGLTSTFFKREGKFFVNTDGPDGKLTDYEVKYTFGVSPLQQYLIEFPDGRLQALSTGLATRTNFTGRVQRKIGTSCVPIATRPMCAKITIPLRINSRHAGRRSASVAKPVTAPARAIWNGPKRRAKGNLPQNMTRKG